MKAFTTIRIALAFAITFLSSESHAQITLDLKVYLEGPYNGTEMNTGLNSSGYLPLSQPYNTAPWNYPGTEGVTSIPNADVIDWVLVELRETNGDASTAYVEYTVGRQAAFLLKNGTIVTLDGISLLQFNLQVNYFLYAVIWHRNHLPVLSGNELVNNGGLYSYDFSSGAVQVYGGLTGHKELVPGKWGMVAGDGTSDGQVNNNDKNDVWKTQAGSSGYLSGDFSMNGQVDNSDKIELWMANSGRSTQVAGNWPCGTTFFDVRDGQIYNTVQVITQCWMAENLNTGTQIICGVPQSDNGIIEKYCFDNDLNRCDEYGGLYQWNEMMQYMITPGIQGICPHNWHIPSDLEWCALEQAVDSTITCSSTGWRGIDGGGKLKEMGTSHWANPNSGATNESMFTALPGGYSDCYGGFNYLTLFGYWWSSSEYGLTHAWSRRLSFDNPQVRRSFYGIGYGYSVRCVKN
ncbi:MAG: hypothetical protein JW861_11750 [Bacteroidales bacterium]|nr:hypothetical protein [Bacteroidales bacterium]